MPLSKLKSTNSDPKKPASDKSIISSQNLTVKYGSKIAIEDVTVDIPLKKVTAIIGPSGCGKSTFLRCINRMNDLIPGVSVEGNLFLGDTNIYSEEVDPVLLRRLVGMVFQSPNPFPKSIYDNVAYGLRIQGKTDNMDEVVESALKRAALWKEVSDTLEEKATGLSGGQQQRLCIARTIPVDP